MYTHSEPQIKGIENEHEIKCIIIHVHLQLCDLFNNWTVRYFFQLIKKPIPIKADIH